MRAFELLTEDAQTKRMVLRALNKLPDEATIFPQVYKQIIGEPLGTRMSNYIQSRGDQDAIRATKWLLQTIPTLGDAKEVKAFISKFANPEFDPINAKALTPSGGMSSPAELLTVVTDPFAKKLFEKIFHDFGGKTDAGPGEAALAILSPNITYGSPGDIVVNGQKIEVKASRSAKGSAGRIWDMPINQKPALKILEPLGMTSFTVLDGEQPFPDPEIAESFITAVCEGWFGQVYPDIVKAFGKPGFKEAWHTHVFDTYKEHSGWVGLLALGLTTYQYVETGEQFAKYMRKYNHGSLVKANEKQSRGLAPQVMVK
jgi:hypothetical protein